MKPRILVLTEAYLPGYLAGGPVRSIANLVDSLGQEFEWLIVTADRDVGCSEPYKNVDIDVWNSLGGGQVFYLGPTWGSLWRLLRVLRSTHYDLMYINSFFSPKFSILPLFGRRLGLFPRKPVLLAPRGEFSEGAIRFKSWKKRMFMRVAKVVGAYAVVNWHASTDYEATDIVREMGVWQSRIAIARNLSIMPKLSGIEGCDSMAPGGVLRICFLSRISRKKNLDFALRVLRQVDCPVRFSIYGPKEDTAYWQECERLLADLPEHINVVYGEALPHERVVEVIGDHDVFFLPTLGENFGHVLLEAWSAGVPVLTSDQTPWRKLQNEGVGWDLPLAEPWRFVNVLREVSEWNAEQHTACRHRCIAFAKRFTDDDVAIETNRQMFLKVLTSVGNGA